MMRNSSIFRSNFIHEINCVLPFFVLLINTVVFVIEER